MFRQTANQKIVIKTETGEGHDVDSSHEYLEWLAQGNSPSPIVEVLTISDYATAIQTRLDDFARTRNYDGILSATTYATSGVAKFKAEGQYAVEARDATWAKGYEILAAVKAGTRTAPTLEGLAAELPALVWPQ